MNEPKRIENPLAVSVGKENLPATAQAESNRAIAEVQAALTVAMANPRDQVKAVDRIINQFTRPGLAENSQYQYSRGGTDISGPSIRAAEAIAQQWGNIQFGFKELSRTKGLDGVGISEVSAFTWDLETNTIRTLSFQVRHWRDKKNGGGYPLSEERDIYELVANQAQRRVRSCILAVIPGDIVETAMKQASETLNSTADTGPESIARMLEMFEKFGVDKDMIEKKIQRRLDAVKPAQMVMLSRIYTSLKDGMSTPAEWFEMQNSDSSGTGDQEGEAAALNDSLKASPKKKAAKKKAAAKKEEPKPNSARTYANIRADIDNAKTVRDAVDAVADIDHLRPEFREELVELSKMKQEYLT